MRLISLALQNFRQHVDTRITFRNGLTGIIGPNGAGKSTILEAMAWAIYGAGAARGTNETIRFARAPGRARVMVEFTFELGGHEYQVTRGLNSAEVSLDGGAAPVATGIGGATRYLQSRIGMTRDEFFNTYFTSQKELQFLALLGPSDRGRFLAQVLGYERLKRAQDLAKDRRKSLHSEIMGIREVLPDELVLQAEREAVELRSQETRAAVTEAGKLRKEREKRLTQVKPLWAEAQVARERVSEIGHAITAATKDAEAARRDIEKATRELELIANAEQSLAPLRSALVDLEPLSKECEQLAALALLAERRRLLEDNLKDLLADLDTSAKRVKELESAPILLQQLTTEAQSAREKQADSLQNVSRLQTEWTAESQDVRTRLQHHLERHAELKDQLEQLKAAGPDGTCPICTRPLGSEFDKVVGLLDEQFEEVKQNGKWLRKRETQLERKPQDLVAAEESAAALQKSADIVAQRVARCEQAVQEIWTLAAERQKKEHKLKQLRAELDKVPGNYDAALHASKEQRLKELRGGFKQATRFEQIIEATPARQKELAEASERGREALARYEAGAARLEELAFDPQHFDRLKLDHEQAGALLHAADLALTQAQARAEAASEQLALVKQAEKSAAENRAKLHDLEIDHKHHLELDHALTDLREELNARVRPELSDLASQFLAQVTDGRYSSLEIDERFNVLVLDEGEEKPVISGGEEDVANLVLRIAISQMIAERAGQQLSVLFLDEVFAALDVERRDNVINLLHRLEDRFEQVVLITHVESIREGLDHTIRVAYDERTGASRVTVEEVISSETALTIGNGRER